MYSSNYQTHTVDSLTHAMKVRLKRWYQKRFVQKACTSELMETVQTSSDRKALGIVALMDVDAMTLTNLMDPEEFRFIQSCHAYLSNHTNEIDGI